MMDWEQIETLSKEIYVTTWYRNFIKKEHVKIRTQNMTDLSLTMRNMHYKINPIIFDREDNSPDDEAVRTFWYLVNLLALCEGPISVIMDVFIMYLIDNKHDDLWSEEKHEFIKEYSELNRIPTSQKISFLKLHGYGFFEDLFPRDLRNAFSHMNFSIKEDGGIVTYSKKGNPREEPIKRDTIIELFKNSTKLMNMHADIINEEFGIK